MMSEKIRRQATELKAMLQRDMQASALERATGLLNGILAEAERVEGLERVAVIPEVIVGRRNGCGDLGGEAA